MTHGIVATLRIREGRQAAFEAIARRLVSAVRANEPGCLLYTLNRGEDTRTYVFMERYRDDEAVAAHRATTHFRTLGREMGEHLDGPPVILRLRELA